MTIKMLKTFEGRTVGAEIDLPPAYAAKWIAAGLAVAVEPVAAPPLPLVVAVPAIEPEPVIKPAPVPAKGKRGKT
jgi:hypothetical protein